MKISKILIKILVVLVLAAVLLIPSTFSWYNHNGSLSGDKMGYTRSDLPVSAGNVSVVTKKYRTENNKLWYDTKGNKEYTDTVSGTTSVPASTVQYYGTTFTNTGSAPAYVNLYLKDFTNSPTVKVGTLQPSLTDKGISSSVHLTNRNKIRVYFQWDKANIWKDSGSRTYVISETADGAKTVTQFDTTTNKLENKPELSNVTTYYADLADNAVSFYFATDAGVTGNVNMTTGEVSQAWYRTRTITNIQAERGYYLTGTADDTTWNAKYNTFDIPGGVSVKTYFDTATINKNQHAYVTLNKGTNYTGASASYSLTKVKDNENNELEISNNTCTRQIDGNTVNVIGINTNTGFITSSVGLDTGYTATITTTITGSLGDSTTVTTAVSNPGTIAGVPVALNVEVPGTSTNDDGETVNGTAEIVWYIDNSATSSQVQFNAIYYTK